MSSKHASSGVIAGELHEENIHGWRAFSSRELGFISYPKCPPGLPQLQFFEFLKDQDSKDCLLRVQTESNPGPIVFGVKGLSVSLKTQKQVFLLEIALQTGELSLEIPNMICGKRGFAKPQWNFETHLERSPETALGIHQELVRMLS